MEQLVVGIIRSPHGVKGNVKVESTSGECEHFYSLTDVTLRKNGTEKNFTVETVEGNTANLIIKFTGIDSPEEAKKYSGAEIVVPKDKACPLKDGEYYVEDLKQCAVIYSTKNDGLADNSAPAQIRVGTITDVLEGGEKDFLEVCLTESVDALLNRTDDAVKTNAGRKVLVPFRKEFIGTVDIKNRVVNLMHLWILE